MKTRERSAEQLIKELKAIEEDEEYCDGEWVGDQEDEVWWGGEQAFSEDEIWGHIDGRKI
jgi:hypothetical protein